MFLPGDRYVLKRNGTPSKFESSLKILNLGVPSNFCLGSKEKPRGKQQNNSGA